MVKIEMESGNACALKFLVNGNRITAKSLWERPPNDDDRKPIECMVECIVFCATGGRYANDGIIGPDAPNAEQELQAFLMGGTNAN